MKNFKTLDLAVEFFDLIEKLGVTGPLREQIIKSSSSISLNLAEGNAKYSVKEKRRFYQTAYASLKEAEVTLRLLKVNDSTVLQAADTLGANLYRLMHSKNLEVKDARNSR
jgi:four helix bundle protein